MLHREDEGTRRRLMHVHPTPALFEEYSRRVYRYRLQTAARYRRITLCGARTGRTSVAISSSRIAVVELLRHPGRSLLLFFSFFLSH